MNIDQRRKARQLFRQLVVRGVRQVIVMRSKMQVYGPDELKVLNQIVNAVLRETAPDTGIAAIPEAHLRERIGKQVLQRAATDVLNVNGIKQAVLASLKN